MKGPKPFGVIDQIDDIRVAKGVSLRELADECQSYKWDLSRIFRKIDSPKFRIVEQMAWSLGYEIVLRPMDRPRSGAEYNEATKEIGGAVAITGSNAIPVEKPMKHDYIKTKVRFSESMKKAGLTIDEVAKILSINRRRVSVMKKGYKPQKRADQERIANILKVTPEYLWPNSDRPNP